jgi:hypothetical protein
VQPEPLDTYRAYVQSLAREILELADADDLTVEGNGDIPIRLGSALYRITLLEQDPPLVRVWARILQNVEHSADLLEELNDLNRNIVSARVFFVPNDDAATGRVIAATEIPAESMDAGDLAHACSAVSSLADWVDTTLMVRFGGHTTFSDRGGFSDRDGDDTAS